MREPVEFEVDGLTFEFSEMPLPEACRGAELVAELIQASGAQGDIAQRVAAAAAKALSKLPDLVKLFAPFCKVEDPSGAIGAGRRIRLAGAVEGMAFNGRIDRAVLFVANCAAAEYSDFLSEGLERVAAGLAELGSRYPSLLARIPGSGDSS